MRNIGMPRPEYQFFRTWLRSTQVIWRDVSDSAIVPAWNEAICREDCLDEKNFTPGQRGWLAIKTSFPKLNLRWRKRELELLSLRPPKYFKSEYHGSLYVADIRSAYSQIYGKLFLHADYPFKRLRYPLEEIAKKLSADKQGRNAVVGIARSTSNKWVQGEKTWFVKKRNPYLSPTLWGQIMMILSQAARISIGAGAKYVNTDGYAFTSRQERDTGVGILEDYGLCLRCAEGEGRILGISALSIPGVKSPVEENSSKPTYHLEPDDGLDWLGWWKNLS